MIACENAGGGGVGNDVWLDKYITFSEIGLENFMDVEAIIVCGEKISVRSKW